MQNFKLSKEGLFEKFHTSEQGLSAKEAESRLRDFGPNELQGTQKKSYIRAYLKQYTQLFAMLLEVAAFLALIADYYTPNEGNDILGYAIFGAVVINASFAFWQE